MSNDLQRAIERVKEKRDEWQRELNRNNHEAHEWDYIAAADEIITELQSLAAAPAEPRFRACHACKQILDETPAVCVDGWIFHKRCAAYL